MKTTPQLRKSEYCDCWGRGKDGELETDIVEKIKGNVVNECYFMYMLW